MNDLTYTELIARHRRLSEGFNDLYNLGGEGIRENPTVVKDATYSDITINHDQSMKGKEGNCYMIVDGRRIITERKYTYHRGGKVVKTNYLHIYTISGDFEKGSCTDHMRECKDGNFKTAR